MPRGQRRPDIYVIARFLDALSTPERRYTRNQLQMAVRLNYDLYRRYLALLLERSLVSIETDASGRDLVTLTDAGRALKNQLETWLKDLLGGL